MFSRLPIVRFPECRLVNPTGLLQHSLAEAKSLEHLHRAAGDAVGLAAEQRAGLLLDDPGLDVGKGDSCAARVKPAGPQPTIRTSTSSGSVPEAPDARYRSAGSEISGSPGSNPFRWNCMNPVSLRKFYPTDQYAGAVSVGPGSTGSVDVLHDTVLQFKSALSRPPPQREPRVPPRRQ